MLEIDIYFVREKVEKNEVEIRYVPTTHQIADVFTQGLPRSRFKFLVDKLHMQQSPIVADSLGLTARRMLKGKSTLRGNVGEIT